MIFCGYDLHVFVLGLIGNIAILYLTLKNRHLQTVQNMFILNLAVSDIVICLTSLPITPITNVYKAWFFASPLCKLIPLVQIQKMLTSWFFVKLHYYVFGIGGIVANSLLLPLIIFCSKRSIGSYRFLIACFISSSLFTSIANTILMPMMSVHKNGWILFASGLTTDQTFGSYFLVLFCISVIILVLSLMYSYIDRLSFFYNFGLFKDTWKCVISALAFVTAAALWSIQTLLCLLPTQHLNEIHGGNLKEVYGLTVSNVSYIATESYDSSGNLQFNFGFVFITRSCVISSCFTVMLTCAYLIHRKLMTDLSFIQMSQRKVHLQKALFRALILQTSIPFFFTYTPITVSILLAFFRLDIPELCEIISLMLPISQFLDPVIIVVFVSDYRRAIKSAVSALSTYSSSKVQSSAVSPSV